MKPLLALRKFCHFVCLWLFATGVLAAGKPDILLLKTYDHQSDLTGWLISEKLDGIRGLWDGKQLITKNGNPIYAPDWFLQQMPPFAIDGELWTKRNDFAAIQSIVLSEVSDERWHQITFHIFEVPNQQGGLLQRLSVLERYLNQHAGSVIRILPQIKVTSSAHLKQMLDHVIAQHGEGLVARKPGLPYQTGRHQQALKIKVFQDDECIVTGYTPGKGKFQGMTGAIRCDWHGTSILIGTGLKKSIRITPPPIGAIITFKYYGKTRYGKPKFASFLRVRQAE